MANNDFFWTTAGSTNPSVGADGSTAPTFATEVGAIDPNGKLQALKVDSSGNLLVDVSAPFAPVTGTHTVSSAVDVMPSTNVKGYGSVSVQTNFTGTATVTFYGSNDNVNFQPVQMGYQAIGVPTTVAASNNIFYSPVEFEFFKVTVTSYVNGNVTAAWIISPGTVGDPNLRSVSINGSTSPLQVDIHDSANNNLTSTGGALDVNLFSSGITLPVSAASLPLPSGAATSALQTTANTSLASIDTKLTAPLSVTVSGTPTISGTVTANQGTGGSSAWKVDGSAVTQPISATSLPLPTGASTAANQTSVQSAPGTPQTVALTIQGNSSGVAVPVTLSAASQPINTSGSIVNTTLTGTTATAAAAPANAVGFIVEASSGNSDNIRWCIGGTSSASVGMRLEPGRDSGYVPCKATVSICAEASTTSNAFQLQWILSS